VHEALPSVGMKAGVPLTRVPATAPTEGALITVKASTTSGPKAPDSEPEIAAMAGLSLRH